MSTKHLTSGTGTDRLGHRWRHGGTLPDVYSWCDGCGCEPTEPVASEPCPKAER